MLDSCVQQLIPLLLRGVAVSTLDLEVSDLSLHLSTHPHYTASHTLQILLMLATPMTVLLCLYLSLTSL